MKNLYFLVALFFLACLSGCQKCEDCTLTATITVDGAGETENVRVGNYCGQDLKDIKDNSSYSKDSIDYNWTCTAE